MLKTYLYIPEPLKAKINYAAKTKATSKAEIMRQALEKGLDILDEHGSATSLLELAKIGKKANFKGIHDSSRIDELLWGKDWSKDE